MGAPPRVGVSVATPDEELEARAGALAAELGLPLSLEALEDHADLDLLLVVAEDALELREADGGATAPVRVRFRKLGSVSGGRTSTARRQPIALAVGLKRGKPTVIDATAGLGRDAWLLASLGCTVHAVERCGILGVMLRDALGRVGARPAPASIIGGRIKLNIADARDVLRGLRREERPEVVYLDPMFPPRRKSALPKKGLRILRRLVGDDPDAGELLDVARTVGRDRVVVKRTLSAPPLGPPPTLSYKGKIARYDVYITGRNKRA